MKGKGINRCSVLNFGKFRHFTVDQLLTNKTGASYLLWAHKKVDQFKLPTYLKTEAQEVLNSKHNRVLTY